MTTTIAPREPDPLSSLSSAVLTEAVQLIEQAGPLDDAAAMREALASHRAPAARIAQRAAALGRRIGLQAELARARHWSPWIALALVLAIVLAGLGLAGNVVGGVERRINIMVALASLLGLHGLTLLFWLIGLVLPLGSFNASFGALWLALTARVAGGRHGQAPVLLRAATQMLARARLLPWAFGFVSHTIWALSFAVVLGALLFALAFRSYTLGWETTILDPRVFVDGVRLLGAVPGWLGFPVPGADAVLAMNPTPADQRGWALWLVGCITVYGLAPRVLFALLSAAVWKARKAALRPDLAAPYYQRLLTRFDALEAAAIVDADPGRAHALPPRGLAAGETGDALMVAGFELPPETPWPPAALPAVAAPVLRVDGSAGQRRELLDTAARLRPRALLVVCHAASSPDRGTERLLRELLGHCGECRLWLLGGDEALCQRWQRWLADASLAPRITAHAELAEALRGWAP